jgi:hypothetical protein
LVAVVLVAVVLVAVVLVAVVLAAVVLREDVASGAAAPLAGAFFPFAGAVTGVGRPSQTGRIPIVQSTGFCA